MTQLSLTFGIITDGNQDKRIDYIINTIEAQSIPQDRYEIIIVGNSKLVRTNTRIIPFDESKRTAWITKKKNIIAQEAKFNNIVILHDYIIFGFEWYDNYCEFGEDWDVAMNPIFNQDNTRFRDWVYWPDSAHYLKWINYNDHSWIKDQYLSGSYYLIKKEFALKHPLNEELSWGQGEDIEWSRSVRDFWNLKCNKKSWVKLLKFKEHHVRGYHK